MVFIDLHLYTGEKESRSEVLFKKYASNIDYVFHLSKHIETYFIQHAGFEAQFKLQGVNFWIKKGPALTNLFSFLLLFYKVRRLNPNVVLLHGMINPFNIIFAKLIFKSDTKILVQNHGERPFQSKRIVFQRLAAKMVTAFIFVSEKQSHIWFKKDIISGKNKIFEIMEGSTHFQFKPKLQSKEALNLVNRKVFLWVGRLDNNKDPMTILRAFSQYASMNSNCVLLMIYNSYELEEEVKKFVAASSSNSQIQLIGILPHSELERYYQASDYFILGSHHEGSGYSLCEAMACGCVPIVTRIPSFEKMLGDRSGGYLFEPGNHQELLNTLNSLNEDKLIQESEIVVEIFKKELSFSAIAENMEKLIRSVSSK